MENFGLISLAELAKKLGKKESTVRTWKLRGKIPKECFKTIGSSIFVKCDEFEKFIKDTGIGNGGLSEE